MLSSKHRVSRVLRVSHQFKNFPEAFSQSFEHYEFNNVTEIENWARRPLVHTNYATIDPLFEQKLENEDVFNILKNNEVKRFSFDIGPCYQKVIEVDGKYVGKNNKLTPADVLRISEERLAKIRHKFPPNCELAVENLNYYPTGAYDGVCDGHFYAMACNKLNVKMVFDISHARVSAANLGQNFSDFIEDFDFSTVTEIHLSRPEFVKDGLAIDAHGAPKEKEYYLLQKIVDRTSGPVDVVIEYYQDVPGIIDAYTHLAEIYP
jgi:hypothetical protein